MLDDPKVLLQRDPQGALVIAASEPSQLEYRYDVAFQFGQPIANVVLTGMGGSAFPANFVATWPAVQVPFVVSRDYTLPSFVGKNTLVIASSFSGNTEETLAALEDARKKNACIVVQANGGKLAEKAKEYGLPFVQIPDCAQPRMAALFFYKAIVAILVAAGLVKEEAIQELTDLAPKLKQAVKKFTPDVPQSQNLAKQLAQHIVGKTAIVYAGTVMFPAAQKWKICINENAKNTAWCNVLPEMNHNEFIGWSSHPIEKPFAVLDLFSAFEHPRTQQRFAVADRLLSGKRPAAIRVEAQGATPLEHLLYLLVLGDFTSVYLAILNGVNPTPVELVEKFKKELG
ncbi:MAG TPA: bifunctional phosphoglucose/phosphomannose isomerase [Candidatus Saccharimonadales bacterium]|nr:bifunctional phosphoglucose/phosphomannose isomerase [Candidatus Saccharimonadales bacterium]